MCKYLPLDSALTEAPDFGAGHLLSNKFGLDAPEGEPDQLTSLQTPRRETESKSDFAKTIVVTTCDSVAADWLSRAIPVRSSKEFDRVRITILRKSARDHTVRGVWFPAERGRPQYVRLALFMTPDWQPISSEEFAILFASSLDEAGDLPLRSRTSRPTAETNTQHSPSRFGYAEPAVVAHGGAPTEEPAAHGPKKSLLMLGLGICAFVIIATSIAVASNPDPAPSSTVQPAPSAARTISSESSDIESRTRVLAAPLAKAVVPAAPGADRDLADSAPAPTDLADAFVAPQIASRHRSSIPLPPMPPPVSTITALAPATARPTTSTTAPVTVPANTEAPQTTTTAAAQVVLPANTEAPQSTTAPTTSGARTIAAPSPTTTGGNTEAPSPTTTLIPTTTTAAPSPTTTFLPTTTTEAPSPTTTLMPTTTEPACHPAYSGACVPFASDVDCEKHGRGKGGNGPEFVSGPFTVVDPGTDPYKLDPDGDGIACDN